MKIRGSPQGNRSGPPAFYLLAGTKLVLPGSNKAVKGKAVASKEYPDEIDLDDDHLYGNDDEETPCPNCKAPPRSLVTLANVEKEEREEK